MTIETLAIAPGRSPLRRLADGLHSLVRAASLRRSERAIRTELSALDNHLLRDMGICRDQLAGAARDAARSLPREGLLRSPLFR